MRIDRNFVPVARSSVVAVEVEGEHVLYDERTERLHSLNSTAGLIWSCCDGTVALGELVDELAEAFGTSSRHVLEDVYAAVRRFEDEDLLETGESVALVPEPRSSPADLGTPCEPCLAKLDALGWAGSVSVQLGELRTGVRATTEAGLALLQQVLAPIALDEPSAAIHYSMVLPDRPADRQARELDQLYFGHRLVVRTRSRARAVRALVSRLDGHLDSTRSGRLLVGGRALVIDDALLLVSDDFAADLDTIEPRLRRLGIAVCDAPSVELAGGGKAVLTEPSLAVDQQVLATLETTEATPQELDQPAGARRLAGWVVRPRPSAAGPVPPADALGAIVATVRNLQAFGSGPALELLAEEVAVAPVHAARRGEPTALFELVVALLEG